MPLIILQLETTLAEMNGGLLETRRYANFLLKDVLSLANVILFSEAIDTSNMTDAMKSLGLD